MNWLFHLQIKTKTKKNIFFFFLKSRMRKKKENRGKTLRLCLINYLLTKKKKKKPTIIKTFTVNLQRRRKKNTKFIWQMITVVYQLIKSVWWNKKILCCRFLHPHCYLFSLCSTFFVESLKFLLNIVVFFPLPFKTYQSDKSVLVSKFSTFYQLNNSNCASMMFEC